MTIQSGDVKLVASQVMDDVENGGGAPTANVIQDGTSNSVFNDISEMDRAGGRVSLRKMFASIQTPTTDIYLGGNIVVADTPDDPNVSVTIFSTNGVFDRRTDARDRIESYLNKAGRIDGYLFENHIAGQRSIQIFRRPSADPIAIGTTLYLSQNENLANEISQYVRVTRVSSRTRTFTEVIGNAPTDYEATIVTCELSDALRYDFNGSPASRMFAASSSASVAKIRDTVVADAAKYYGASVTTAAVALGDISVGVNSIYTKLVPSAQTETPIVDANAGGNTQPLIDASNGNVVYSTSHAYGPSTSLYLGAVVVPASLSILFGGNTLTDSGGSILFGTTVVGTIDYATGLVNFASNCPDIAGEKTISFRAGAAPVRVSDTTAIPVTTESRSYNYNLTLIPSPEPGTVVVSYRSQGKWYDLKDNGSGALLGADRAYGVGTVSFSTGSISVTLGALPDAGSCIMYSWGTKVSYFNRAANVIDPAKVKITLAHRGATPNGVSITWNAGGAKSAQDDGAGHIVGDATGTVDYATGVIELTPSTLPPGGVTYHLDYTYGPTETENFSQFSRNGDTTISLTLAEQGIHPGSFKMTWPLTVQAVNGRLAGYFKEVFDDRVGNLRAADGAIFGTINYAAGTLNFNPASVMSIPTAKFGLDLSELVRTIEGTAIGTSRQVFTGWEYLSALSDITVGGTITTEYRVSATDTGNTEDFLSGAITFNLAKDFSESIVPGSVAFTLGGKNYFDRSGVLYTDLNTSTGVSTQAGTVNYQTGEATVTVWTPAAGNTLSLRSLLTSLDGTPVDAVSFRIPLAPVRPSSVQVLATKTSGETINVTADSAGKFENADCVGTIDYETGVVRLAFGAWITAAGHEAEPYYSADAVVAGKIFRPAHVFADTVKYNAVAYSYLPLNADLIGLDPVRLPQDGRVPIFREGDFAVIGHTAKLTARTVSNNQTVDCGRVRLSRVRVIGDDGLVINTGYSADLEAGTVTFSNVSGYAQPVIIEHRIEDMAQVSDVQISGHLVFTRQITHNYPVGSVVSSALATGDLHAHVPVMFDQASWDGSFSSSQVGGQATGTFNDVLAPIEVTNAGAVTERWAIQFTNATAFRVIGEHVGVIAVGNTASPISPNNPATGEPYFTINPIGWGEGWATGNVVRFDTVGALFPFWAVRTVQQGIETVTEDSFSILVRGDVDRVI